MSRDLDLYQDSEIYLGAVVGHWGTRLLVAHKDENGRVLITKTGKYGELCHSSKLTELITILTEMRDQLKEGEDDLQEYTDSQAKESLSSGDTSHESNVEVSDEGEGSNQ
jgi:hypothetical protein